MLLEDYNYFINKAINQYINKAYNKYDINQQSTDDLRVLKSTAILQVAKKGIYSEGVATGSTLLQNTFEALLPDDYLHILNCLVEYDVKRRYKCYDKDSKWRTSATRLTADMWSQVYGNFYMRPSYKKPYFYINNVNIKNTYKTEDDQEDIFASDPQESVEREAEERYGNQSKVKLELRYGDDDKIFEPSLVYVDYIKAPKFVRLTHDQVDEVADNSQVLEFPDYVCQEIVNELVMLLLENASDQRIQTHPPINQSIANPAQQQEK